MMKYLSGLHSHIKKEVILFEVKTLDEACKKAMYVKAKHGKRPLETASTSKSESRKTPTKKGPPNKRKFAHTTQKGVQCEHCHVHGHKKEQC
jgi:hypothetical protein